MVCVLRGFQEDVHIKVFSIIFIFEDMIYKLRFGIVYVCFKVHN